MSKLYFNAMEAIERLPVGETASNAHAHGTTPDHIDACNCASVERTGPPPEPAEFTRLFDLLQLTSEVFARLVNNERIGAKDLPYTPAQCSGCKAVLVTNHCKMLENYRETARGYKVIAQASNSWESF